VIGPTTKKDGLEPEVTDAVTLAALERLDRSYGADPDRVFVAGISMGGAIACEHRRAPSRPLRGAHRGRGLRSEQRRQPESRSRSTSSTGPRTATSP